MKLQVFLPPAKFKSDGTMPNKPDAGCLDRAKMSASKVTSFVVNFFRISGTSEVETWMSRKTECLCYRQVSRLTFQLVSPVASDRFDSLAKTNFSLARYSNSVVSARKFYLTAKLAPEDLF